MASPFLRLLPLAVCAALLPQSPVWAASTTPQEQDHVNREAAEHLAHQRAALVNEAMIAEEDMLVAIMSLAHQDKDTAYKALQDASGKLDVVLARDPHLKQVPMNVHIATQDLNADPKSVRESLNEARKALAADDVQKAKALLHPLASEIRITTQYLPLDSYPAAIRKASQEIQAGHTQSAAQLLSDALHLVVTKETIIPLPPMKAETDVEEAQALLDSDPKKNAAQASAHLKQADEQLKLGKLLGYGDYRDIRKEMDSVQKKLDAGQGSSGLLGHLKELLHEAHDKL